MVMIRQGDLKFIHCDSDDPKLFDLSDDPQELSNLADKADYHDTVLSFTQQIKDRWNLDDIRESVIANQQSRLMIQQTMNGSRTASWDYQPLRDASEDYVRSHKEPDDMAEARRYPRFTR